MSKPERMTKHEFPMAGRAHPTPCLIARQPMMTIALHEPGLVWSSGFSRLDVALHEARGNPSHPVVATRRRLKAGLRTESKSQTSSRSRCTAKLAGRRIGSILG